MEEKILVSPYIFILFFVLGILITLYIQSELKSFQQKREKEQYSINYYILSYGLKISAVFVGCSYLYFIYIK